MDAKLYLQKLSLICDKYHKNCENCPLLFHSCGYPVEGYEMDITIEVMEKYELPKDQSILQGEQF